MSRWCAQQPTSVACHNPRRSSVADEAPLGHWKNPEVRSGLSEPVWLTLLDAQEMHIGSTGTYQATHTSPTHELQQFLNFHDDFNGYLWKRSLVINQLQNESDIERVTVLGIADVLKNTAGAQYLIKSLSNLATHRMVAGRWWCQQRQPQLRVAYPLCVA